MSRMDGPWKDLEQDLNGIGARLTANLQLTTAQNAEIVRKALVKHIQNQDLQWAKLNPKYLAYKKGNRLSTATLIATSEFLQSITTQMSSDKLSAFVGVLRNAKRKDGEPGVLVAEIHEFGSRARNIPPRPLFRPTFAEIKPEVADRFKAAIKEVLETVGT